MANNSSTLPGCVQKIETFEPEVFLPIVESMPSGQLSFLKMNKSQVVDQHFLSIKTVLSTGKLFGYYTGEKLEAIAGISRLDWDSAHFGFESYQLSNMFILPGTESSQVKLAELMNEILTFAKSNDVKFISAIIDSYDIHLSKLLQNSYFKFILTWLQGNIPAANVPAFQILPDGHEIGLVTADEIDEYSRMAQREYFTGGRFFMDKKFDEVMVRQMYAQLVQSAYHSEDIMLSYKIRGESVGLFVSKKIQHYNGADAMSVAPLRFLVVKPAARKVGVGRALFNYTLKHLANEAGFITTGLEVHNLPSLNLHAKLPFNFHHTQNVFHWWNE